MGFSAVGFGVSFLTSQALQAEEKKTEPPGPVPERVLR